MSKNCLVVCGKLFTHSVIGDQNALTFPAWWSGTSHSKTEKPGFHCLSSIYLFNTSIHVVISEPRHHICTFVSRLTVSIHFQSYLDQLLFPPYSSEVYHTFLMQWVPACVPITLSCLTLHDPVGCSPQDSPVHGISQARFLEWVAIPFSRGSSRPRDPTRVS